MTSPEAFCRYSAVSAESIRTMKRFSAERLSSGPLHEALGGIVRALFEVLKSDCRVDEVAHKRLAGRKVTMGDVFDGFAQKGMTKS